MTTAGAAREKSVRCRSNFNWSAPVRTCSVGQPGGRLQRLAPSRPVRGKRSTAHRKRPSQFAQIRHIVRHKTGRWKRQRAASAAGDPRDPAADRFMSHNVLLSYGRKDAQAAPSRPRLAPLRSGISQARERARERARIFRASLSACHVAGGSGRRLAFRVDGLKRRARRENPDALVAIVNRWPAW